MEIGVDTNQFAGSHGPSNRLKHSHLAALGCTLFPLPLPVGDYIEITSAVKDVIASAGEDISKKKLLPVMQLSIDTKKDLNELCGNICQGHKRFRRELLKAQANGIKLVILVEDKDIHCMADVYLWRNPKLKVSAKAVKGPALYKSMRTIEEEYDVTFVFCSRMESGQKIKEILEGGVSNDNRFRIYLPGSGDVP